MICPSCGKPMEEGEFGVSSGSVAWSIWWRSQDGKHKKLRNGHPLKGYFTGHLCNECKQVMVLYEQRRWNWWEPPYQSKE